MSIKILLAEDDPIAVLLIKRILKKIECEVTVAENGAIALQCFKEHPGWDLILMDMMMPEMNGFEATREIRKLNQTVPIIAQTALSSESDRENTLKAGCTDYIKKPIDMNLLLFMVKKHTE